MSVIPTNLVEIVTASGASSLPNRPSAEGYSAAQIKSALNRGNKILASLLVSLDDARIHDLENVKMFVSSLGDASNYQDGTCAILLSGGTISVYVHENGAWEQVGLTASQIEQMQTDLDALELVVGGFLDGTTIVKAAQQDENGNNIASTYETKADSTAKDNANVHTTGNETIAGNKTFKGQTLFDGHITFGYQKSILMWDGYLRTTTPSFVQIGGDSAHIVTYTTPYSGSGHYGETWTLATNEDLTDVIDGTTPVAKATGDADGNAISSTYVKKAQIYDGVDSTATNVPLSANQGKVLKGLIDNINTLLQSNDTDLDELQEIVTYIKNNKSLIDGITSSKVNVADIIDNLNSQISNKPLSANQGYVLDQKIETLTDDYIALGLVEVGEYNESAGTVSLTHAASLSSSYESTTGVLSITY